MTNQIIIDQLISYVLAIPSAQYQCGGNIIKWFWQATKFPKGTCRCHH